MDTYQARVRRRLGLPTQPEDPYDPNAHRNQDPSPFAQSIPALDYVHIHNQLRPSPEVARTPASDSVYKTEHDLEMAAKQVNVDKMPAKERAAQHKWAEKHSKL